MFRNIQPPSSATAISWLALTIALGGTAFAAGATFVKIQDGSTANIAAVDLNGALKTTVAPADTSFSYYAAVLAHTVLIPPTRATVVLSDFALSNSYAQTNAAHAQMHLYQYVSTGADCTGTVGASGVGVYQAAAGQTFQAVFPTGMVLKPPRRREYWCLTADYTLQGNPSTYSFPEVTFHGYVLSGNFSLPSLAEPARAFGQPPHT